MSLPAAYLGVVLIWGTTPLAIKWSTEGPGFLFGVTGRMVIGVVVALALTALFRVSLPREPSALATYATAGLGIYGAMLSVYWSAQFIPSGWISVLFGLTPMVTGLLASLLLSERALSIPRFLGMGLGLAGLAVMFGETAQLEPGAVYGVAGVLFAVTVHAGSSVLIKRFDAGVSGMATTTGALAVAVPLFLATWWLLDGVWPGDLVGRAGAAMLYLGVFGSVVGFALYFFVLQRTNAVRVALITLVTPVLALLIGHGVNQEPLDGRIWAGTGLIISGLLVFELAGLRRLRRFETAPQTGLGPGS